MGQEELSLFMILPIDKVFRMYTIGTIKWISNCFLIFRNIDQKVGCWIVGNKLDMNAKRVVSYEEGLALGRVLFILANRYQVPFMETSAKTSENVAALFEELTRQIIRLNKSTNKVSIRRPPLPINPDHKK